MLENGKVRYSATYPTGRERLRNSGVECAVGADLMRAQKYAN